MADLAALQRVIGVKFKQLDLLERSMVHRSYLNEALEPGVESNERLEFLGDAVLGCVVAQWLYERYPGVHEGRLTELRAQVVKGETLAGVAERLGLGRFLLLGRGEDATGGRLRPLNLGRAFEALVGAIYLDRGFAATERFLQRVLKPEMDELGQGDLPRDSKSRLQHMAQKVYGSTPHYRTVSAIGPDHAKTFTIEVVIGDRSFGAGTGRTKQIAQVEAAREALARIDHELAAAQVEA